MKIPLTVIMMGCVCLMPFSVVVASEEIPYPGWNGRIEKENGITVIKNPKEPLFGEISLELVEELSIGDEEGENTAFWKGVKIAVNDSGDIFVLDRGNFRVQIFDSEGRFMRSFGRKGQGPGEFQYPSGICIDSEGEVWINDHYRISLFDQEGNFIHGFPMPQPVFQWAVIPDGSILGVGYIFDEEKLVRTQNILLVSPLGNLKKTIISYPHSFLGWVGRTPVGETLSHRLSLQKMGNNGAVFGHTSVYRIYAINAGGTVRRIIERKAERIPYRRSDRDKAVNIEVSLLNRGRTEKLSKSEVRKALNFPDHKPYFLGFEVDNLENTYVLPYPDKRPGERLSSYTYDFFDSAGYFLFKIKAPLFHIEIIRNEFIYTGIRDNDTGYIRVKRYRIKNWNFIQGHIRM